MRGRARGQVRGSRGGCSLLLQPPASGRLMGVAPGPPRTAASWGESSMKVQGGGRGGMCMGSGFFFPPAFYPGGRSASLTASSPPPPASREKFEDSDVQRDLTGTSPHLRLPRVPHLVSSGKRIARRGVAVQTPHPPVSPSLRAAAESGLCGLGAGGAGAAGGAWLRVRGGGRRRAPRGCRRRRVRELQAEPGAGPRGCRFDPRPGRETLPGLDEGTSQGAFHPCFFSLLVREKYPSDANGKAIPCLFSFLRHLIFL